MKLWTAFGMFYRATELRLADKQRAGWRGWNSLSAKTLRERLLRNVESGDWVDVANIAMFLWIKRWKDENKSMQKWNT